MEIIPTEEQSNEIQNSNTEAGEKNSKYILLNKSTIQKPPYIADISRKLLCVQYPGIVENIDKAIETLGGLHSIETAVGNYNRRLELRYRPNDVFSKPCWGEKDYNTGILVKIKISQPNINSSIPTHSKANESNEPLTSYAYDVVGATALTFQFSRLCDFQYLPLLPTNKKKENANSSCQAIYENIIPKSLPTWEWFLSKESVAMPLFFPPPVFSRFNTSKDKKLYFERYKYYESLIPEYAEKLKKEAQQKKKPEPKNIITRSRSERKLHSVFINAYSKDTVIPMEPTKQASETIQRLALDGYPSEQIKKLFDERPIWSKAALSHKTGIRYDRLKFLLPSIGYYFSSGPWRVMWCRFGFDPRLEPSARVYQTFDFRIRTSEGLKVKVQAKKSFSNLIHYKGGQRSINKLSLKDCCLQKTTPRPIPTEDHYILKPNMLPAARQMFYQYCDLHIPEIQNMLQRLPDVPKGAVFNIKNGWLPNGFGDQCREIANRYITSHVKTLLLEDKKQTDEDNCTTQAEDNLSNSPTIEETNLPSPILIIDNDDEDDDENPFGKKHNSDLYSDADENIDTDDEVDLPNSDVEMVDEDIDMETVNEINNIIENINHTESPQNDDIDISEDELPPELENLYRTLVITPKNKPI